MGSSKEISNKTPLPVKEERNEEICDDRERERPVVIPLVVRVVPIGVNPLPIVVAVRVEHVRVAIRVGYV